MEAEKIKGFGFDAEIYHNCIKKFLITSESSSDIASKRFKTDFLLTIDDELFTRLENIWEFVNKNRKMHLMTTFLIGTLKNWSLIQSNNAQYKAQIEFIIGQIENTPEFKSFKYHPLNLN